MKSRSIPMVGAAIALAIGVLGYAGTASAGLVNCPSASVVSDGTAVISKAGVPGQLTAASACQYLVPPDNSVVANTANVNANNFFGSNNWTYVVSLGVTQQQLTPGAPLSGLITIDPASFATKDYMVVFKDGQGTNLVGFLLNELTNQLAWRSPFTNEIFSDVNVGQVKGVSHYSVFERVCQGAGCVRPPGGATEVPAPASLALLGAALLGIGAMRRRFG